ncbi:hypothetical protein WEH80_20110 [Actinomycetes bacterium KLBMP 9759]
MSRKTTRVPPEMAAAAMLAERLIAAVEETVEEGSPEPGRTRVERLLELGLKVESDEEGRTTELMVTLILVRWLSVVRERLVDEDDRVERVLGWVDTTLGHRYAARARYTSAVLHDEARAPEIMGYRKALRDDFLPSLVWLLAGAVATYGEGDVAWLGNLVGAPTSR